MESSLFGTQCKCSTQRTVFPAGVESFVLAFDHAFNTTGQVGGLSGSTGVPAGADNNLVRTTVVDIDGRALHKFAAGERVALNLSMWLAAGGVELDEVNYQLSPDATDPSKYPHYRTSGVSVRLSIHYSNLPQGSEGPALHNTEVEATVSVEVDSTQWAGAAVIAPVYEAYPSGGPGARSYRKVYRYTQGCVFDVRASGSVYTLDVQYLIAQMIGMTVLVGLASTITAFVAQFVPLLGRKKQALIQQAARNKLAMGTRLAEMGMKTLAYASTFAQLDRDGDGQLTVGSIISTLARTGHAMSPQQANAVAQLVLLRSQDDGGDKIDFAEFVACMEVALDSNHFFRHSFLPLTRFESLLLF